MDQDSEETGDEFAPLLKADGAPFDDPELAAVAGQLAGLDQAQRGQVRSANAEAIAASDAARLLLVSGPGTGKSTLFRARIRRWLAKFPAYEIRVATFVRKLVQDLRDDLATASDLDEGEKNRVHVSTLHHLARSIVERAHGTAELPLDANCQVVGSSYWELIVWEDAVSLHDGYSLADFPWSVMADSLYDGEPRAEAEWVALRQTHLRLQQFYNAVTFSELILLAAQAVRENSELASGTLFIIDEFQDFNLAEEALIRALSTESPGLLLVGDDDQVLYDGLRRAHASIIRDYYRDPQFANAMLPFCSRCGFHICWAAASFLRASATGDAISKLFLPFQDETGASKVRVIATTQPQLGVTFIGQWLEEHQEAIRAREQELAAKTAKDPYLLILTPAREMNFRNVGGARDRLNEILGEFMPLARGVSQDYWVLRDYYAVTQDRHQNFFVRRILHHEGLEQPIITAMLRRCLDEGKDFVDLGDSRIDEVIKRAERIAEILEGPGRPAEQVAQLLQVVPIAYPDELSADLDDRPIGKLPEPEEDSPSLQQPQAVSAVQVETIVGAKGMSADHVIVLGCDQANLRRTTRNAFFVAMTRARRTLTLLACMGGGGANRLHPFVVALPDENVEAGHLKAAGVTEYSSIAALDGHLEDVDRARKRATARAKASKRQARRRP